MPPSTTVIYLHPEAPEQPALGATCNGCGVCCALSPCPLGRLLTWRVSGPCRLLRWHPAQGEQDPGQYRCGALMAAASTRPLWREALTKLVRRGIASGQGCDCPSRSEPGAR